MENSKTDILITGASGFLGRHLVKFFKEKKFNITCQVRTATSYKRHEDIFANCMVLIGDIADTKFVDILFSNHFDYIIHAAACKYIDACEQFPLQCMESNFYGTFNILKKANSSDGLKNLVFISTDKAENPTGMYGYSKLMGEWMTRSYGYNVYRGVNFWASDGSFIDKWMKAINEGSEVILNDPSHVRYFRFIKDVVNDIYEVLLHPEKGRVFEPLEVMEVPILDVYNRLKHIYPGSSFSIGKAHHTEKKYEDISSTIVVKQVPVEKLLDNLPNNFICN